MLWRNLSSVRGQTHEKLTSVCFSQQQDPKMVNKVKGKRRRKLAVNKDKWILLKMTRTLSIAFSLFDWLLKKSIKSRWQFDSWKLNLKALHKLKFYPSVFLLTIKMSQSAREKLDNYCKKIWKLSVMLGCPH